MTYTQLFRSRAIKPARGKVCLDSGGQRTSCPDRTDPSKLFMWSFINKNISRKRKTTHSDTFLHKGKEMDDKERKGVGQQGGAIWLLKFARRENKSRIVEKENQSRNENTKEQTGRLGGTTGHFCSIWERGCFAKP